MATFNITFGALASAFVEGTDVNDIINEGDGKIVIVGNFTRVNGVAMNNICRLNSDGTIDTTFNIGTGTDATINCITPASTGGYFIGGNTLIKF